MQDVNLLQGLVRRVGDCRAVHDDHRIELRSVRSSGSIIVPVFILRAVVKSDVQSYNHVSRCSSQPEPQPSKIST